MDQQTDTLRFNFETLKHNLSEFAELADAPDGMGGGAILLDARTAIELLESQIRRPPRREPEPA